MGKKRINITFKRYDLNYKNHQYCVLIPKHIDQLWVTSAGTPHWGVSFTANMDGLRALMYSFALLGFNPYNKIVYFPLRKNVIPRYYDLRGAFPGESPTEVVDCDLVFAPGQTQLKRGKWKKLKEMMRYTKATTYHFHYDRERTMEYFKKRFRQWKESIVVETIQAHTLFEVMNRWQFQRLYLEIERFIRSNPEGHFEHGVKTYGWGNDPMDGLEINFKMREKRCKTMQQMPWVLYYDLKFERLTSKLRDKR